MPEFIPFPDKLDKGIVFSDHSGFEQRKPEEVLPGEVCPTCGEKTPSERALKMREWRAKRAAD